ncbi:sensory box protein [Thauera sp. SWB20]|nr:sensory box protein [Thauera sp. SWB20]
MRPRRRPSPHPLRTRPAAGSFCAIQDESDRHGNHAACGTAATDQVSPIDASRPHPPPRAGHVLVAALALGAGSAQAAGIDAGGLAWNGGLVLLGGGLGYLLGRRSLRRRTLAGAAEGCAADGPLHDDAPASGGAASRREWAGTPADADDCAPASALPHALLPAAHAAPSAPAGAGAAIGVVATESYREVVDSLSEVLFRTDELGRLVFLNDAWKDLSGFDLDATRQHALTDFLHPDDRLRARDAIRALLCGDGQEWTDELRLRTLSGEIRWVAIDCRALRDGSGQESGIAGTIDDISARKIAEFSLRNLNQELESRVRSRTAELETAVRELEAFSYSVSHDLRAPLRAIDGFARILVEEAGPRLDERQREQLVRIRAGAERMAILIDALIDLASVSRQPLRRRPVDLSRIAEAVIRDLQAESPGRVVAVEITSDMTVVADPVLMHVLLDNLLRNAWKFTSQCEHPRIVFGAERDGERTVFHVEDNGAGFEMNYAGKLFQPFQRLHAQHEFPGTGIGLATVQRIVARHEGRVWASAEPGKGARFCFMLGH